MIHAKKERYELDASALIEVWRYSQRTNKVGLCSSLMLILYGIMRVVMEYLRDDNPYEMLSLTISQIMSLGLVVLGTVLLIRMGFSRQLKS